MSVVEPAPGAPGLVDRAKNIILKPSEEWTKIEAERPTIAALYAGYVMPLAAIPVLAGMIGAIAFGLSGFSGRIPISPLAVITSGVLQYVFILVAVYLMALVIDGLAETFGGKKDSLQALKTAAYSATAGWLAGVFGLYPPLGMLSILGLYSLFLLYRGLPILMKAPPERAMAYTATVVVVLIVIAIVFATLSSCVMNFGAAGLVGPAG